MAAGTDIESQQERKKSWVTILLFMSCIATLLLLWKIEPVIPQRLTSQSQIDSLITLTFYDLELPPTTIRKQHIEVDSVFTRIIYNVKVAPEFSKTTLHYFLQKNLWPYKVRTVAGVEFPERDMTIHLLMNDTIQRTLVVETDPEIEYIPQNFYTPPDQITDEVD